MKALHTIIFLFLTKIVFGQISLEHTFPTGTVMAHIIEEDEIIYSHSVLSGEFPNYQHALTFYNSDFQSIGSVNIESAISYAHPANVSRLLFNNDDQIEYSIQSGYILDGTLSTEIRNLNGSVLFQVDNCLNFPVYNSSSGAYALAACYASDSYENPFTRVYSLPGSLPSGLAENDHQEVIAYPNPSKSFINIPTEGATQVDVYNTMGQKVLEMPANGIPFLQVPTSHLAPGTYIYQTSSAQEVKPGKMFVVE